MPSQACCVIELQFSIKAMTDSKQIGGDKILTMYAGWPISAFLVFFKTDHETLWTNRYTNSIQWLTQAMKQSFSKHSRQASFQPPWGPAHRRIPWKQELSTHRETHSERLVKRLACPHKRALVGWGGCGRAYALLLSGWAGDRWGECQNLPTFVCVHRALGVVATATGRKDSFLLRRLLLFAFPRFLHRPQKLSISSA